MRKSLTLTASLYFLGISALCFGTIMPVGAQDPQTLFGGDKAPAANALPKSKASANKAPAAKPAAAPAKASAAAPATAAPAKAAAATPATAAPAKAAVTHAKPAAARAKAAAAAPAESSAGGATATAEPAGTANSEVKPSSRAGAKASLKAAPKQHSTAAGGPRPAGHFAGGPAMPSAARVSAYCGKLWNKIQNNWQLATGKNHVILGVDVDAGGNVFSTKVSSQPKNGDAEAKAQEALTKSQPLEALPSGLPSAHLTITFDSTADPHGDSNSGGSVRLEYNPGASTGATVPSSSSTPAAPTTSE